MRKQKFVHVHLLFAPAGKKNRYFTSVTNVFKHLTEQDIGITLNTLLHRPESLVVTKRAIITKGYLEDWKKRINT